ncbi:MAG: phosphoribosylanthranilate isomerase [bacterium]
MSAVEAAGAAVVPHVKICCMLSVEEAHLAARYGAWAIGLVSEMPSGPGPIPEERIVAIAADAPAGVRRFLLTSLTSAEEIAAQQRRCGVDAVQLCDRPAAGAHEALRRALPGVSLVQVIHVEGEDAVADALDVAPRVDFLLLDSGRTRGPVRQLGGTGRAHDWSLSRRIVERSPVPVFLAGGLRAENVAEAIRRVQPFGVDVCTGVRTDGKLDETKLAAFFAAVSGE